MHNLQLGCNMIDGDTVEFEITEDNVSTAYLTVTEGGVEASVQLSEEDLLDLRDTLLDMFPLYTLEFLED